MKIFHISAECYPIAKVGGLADVVGALPKYQNNLGATSSVVMPFYDNAFTQKNNFKSIYEGKLDFNGHIISYNILKTKAAILDFEVYFVDIPNLLYKNYVYSQDDTDRFFALQIATLDWILK